MVTTGRADNIAEQCTLAILPVCCLFFCCCYLFGLPHAAWLWQRDNDKEDGCDDDGTRGQHHRRKYVDYATYLVTILTTDS